VTPLVRAAIRLYRLWQRQPSLAQRRYLHARLHVYWAQMDDEQIAAWQAATGVQHMRIWLRPYVVVATQTIVLPMNCVQPKYTGVLTSVSPEEREERIEWP